MEVFGLILLLFCACGGEAFTVRGPAVPLVVQVGASVTLPCSADTPLPLSELEGRSFSPEQVSKGHFSLLLVNVTTEDKGLYKCVVHTDQESHETMMEIDIERLVVTGAVEPVSAYVGEDVILNCSVDTHVPVGQLQVEWVKNNELGLVLLFAEGENIPESQDERFRGRAEFFSEEIPKGNFSMKLRDVRTEDKGEFMCKVHTDQESISATAWIEELGFSSLHLLVLVCTISSAVVAVSVCIRALWFYLKKDQSNRVFLHYLHDSIPCILMAIAFTIWGAIESSFKEAFVCSAINFSRILVIFKMAPYKKLESGSCSWRLVTMALPLEYLFITAGVSSDVIHRLLQLHILNTKDKALLVFCVVFLLLWGLLAVGASVSNLEHLQRHLECLRRHLEHLRRHCQRRVVNETVTQALQIRWPVFVALFINIDSFIIMLNIANLTAVISVGKLPYKMIHTKQ
ncbi:hypothetical protein GJAV_G00048710 [Gymnothorax javanicus]|nr:hypothetical protein GJAV_G00048710 [Gymnothorax javanicus]